MKTTTLLVLLLSPLQSPTPTFHWHDCDGDGVRDAFVVGVDGTGHLLLGDGDGGLVGDMGGRLPALDGLAGACFVDLDGDGAIDLLAWGSGGTRWFRSQLGGFVEATAGSGLERVGGAEALDLLDTDGDGRLDLVLQAAGRTRIARQCDAGVFESFLVELPVAADVHDDAPLATSSDERELPAPDAGAQGPAAGPSHRPGRTTRPISLSSPVPGPRGREKGDPRRSVASDAGPTIAGSGRGTSHELGGLSLTCAATLSDQALGECLAASSVATLGMLYPLSSELFVDAATGFVGLGTTAPAVRLDVAGEGRVDALELPSDTGLTGLVLRGAEGPGQGGLLAGYNSLGAETFRLEADDSSGAVVRMKNDAGSQTIVMDSDTGGSGHGRLFLNDDAGATRIDLNVGSGAGELTLRALDGSSTVFLDGEGDNAGGKVEVRTDGALVSGRLSGDDGGDSGQLELWNRSGGNNFVGLSIHGRDAFGTGGLLSIRDDQGLETIELDGDVGTTGSLLVRETDGTTAFEANGDTLRTYDSSGARTLELDRENRAFRAYGASPASVQARLDSSGSIGRMTLYQGTSRMVDLQAFAPAGYLEMFETDGSTSFKLSSNTLTLHDSNGVVTVSFNRQTGAKNGVVHTEEHGARYLYAVESPEVWFEDVGGGRLAAGTARVELDPVYLATVTVDERHPLRVFVTMNGESERVVVEKDVRGFTVRELEGGASDAPFDWRVLAKRRGLEDARLEPADELASDERP